MTGTVETITMRQYLVTELMMNMPNVDYRRAQALVDHIVAPGHPEWDLDVRRTWDQWEAIRMEAEKRHGNWRLGEERRPR